jgi:predicted metal-dependent phosphoesterase TrpH
MREQYCDLHTHSRYSDGTAEPAEIIDLAEEIGLSAVALTDHNTVEGLPEFLAAAEGKRVRAIAGVEFSTLYGEIERELHILALFVSPKHFDEVTALAEKPHEDKERSNLALLEALRGIGINLDYEKMKASTKGTVNRAHFAAEMVAQGYVKNNNEAFLGVLHPDRGYYRAPKRLDAFETIAFIKSIGAVAILAHPLMHLNEKELNAFLEKARNYGLDGIETEYSEFSRVQTEQAKCAAERFGLLQSGGSDFHGKNKKHISLGTGVWGLQVPMSFAEALEKRAKEI